MTTAAATSVQAVLTKREAQSQIHAIQRKLDAGVTALEQAKEMVEQFDEREGYKALGYRSLAACLAAELAVSRQHAYRLLDTVRGRTALLGTPAQATAAGGAQPATRSARSGAVHIVDREHEPMEGDVMPEGDVDPGDQTTKPDNRVIRAVEMLVDAGPDEYEAITAKQYRENRDTFIAAHLRLTELLNTREG